jgi:Rhs element Vgr protein
MSIGIKKISIQIGGTDLKDKISVGFQSLSLSQSIGNHHSLTLVFRKDVMESDTSLLKTTVDFLGKPIELSILTEVSEVTKKEEKIKFKGIVAGISAGKSNAFSGDSIVITATSPDIKMDDGAHSKSFEEKTLKDIVSRVFDAYAISDTNIQPSSKSGTHPYIVQYRETSFNFISRLAQKYGQWFFYDGEKLHFGELKKTDTIDLKYGNNIFNFNLRLKVEPFTFELVAYDYKDTGAQKYKSKDDSQNVALSKLGKEVVKHSDELFTHTSSLLYNHSLTSGNQQDHLNHRVELKKAGKASGVVVCSGTTDSPLLKIGCIIKITEKIKDSEITHGEYIVVDLQHSADRTGEYSNSFTAIPSECEIPFTANPHAIPVCETQSAIVTDNEDPDKMGRIRVHFFWQADGEKSPWLRIVNPYSGKEKGHLFIPEIDEEVLIGFEGGNAEKPFVIGTMFHAKAKPESWDPAKNNIKAIRTRSGHTIEFRDHEGEEEIWIYDYNKENYFIKMKSHAQEITIEAVEHIQLKAKNISILAEKDLKIEATDVYNTTNGNVESKVSGNTQSTVTGNVSSSVTGNVANNVSGNIKTEATGSITSEATANMTIKGSMNTTVEAGAKATIKAGTQIEESAGIININ